MAAEAIKPKYWMPGYDAWHLALLPVLAIFGVALAVMKSPKTESRAGASHPVVPHYATVIDQPQAGAVLRSDQLGEVMGRAEPGARVILAYRTVTTSEKILSESAADSAGRYSFRLAGFPAGSYGIRVAAVFPDGQVSTTLEIPFRVIPPPSAPKPESKRKARGSAR